MKKTFKTTLLIIGVLLVILLSYVTHPNKLTKTEQIFDNKIWRTEKFYNEAKAMSLSLSILSDTIVKIYSDSLRNALIDLNESWVIFIKHNDNYAEYIPTIQTLNINIEVLRHHYEIEMGIRIRRKFQTKEDNYLPESKKSLNI